jgi:mannose-1-phosphate guanylyltransferase
VGRNTAPAITIACFALPEDDIVLLTPSDHYIKDQEEYIDAGTYGELNLKYSI